MVPIDSVKLHPSHNPQFSHFPSRRSTVFSAKGAIVTSQPLGLEILNKGGNAADAAVATAAAMNICEPCSTGIGGAKKVRGINGSGRSPKALTLEYLRSVGVKGDEIPATNLNSVTVPCAAAGWIKTIEEFGSGRLSVEEILEPAIRMAREGVPVHELCSESRVSLILEGPLLWTPFQKLIDQNAYAVWTDTFEAVAKHGKAGYYKGRIAQETAIVDLIQSKGGLMTLDDLAECEAEVIEPIKYDFRVGIAGDEGVTLWECPPNGQGLTALVALGIIEALESQQEFDILELEHNSTLYLHVLIESLRLAFADTAFPVPVDKLLGKPYLAERAKLINLKRAIPVAHGNPVHSSDTIYLSTADKEGNACSFIASNYAGCGFTLQNRGSGFTLREGHPNCVAGGKRPYHTIIPAMATAGDELLMSFGVMGGFMQPQGHIQVLLNKLRGFSTQACLDAPRFCISAGLPDPGAMTSSTAGDIDSEIWFEEGIPIEVIEELKSMGHTCERATGFKRKVLGRGQIIQRIEDPSGRTVWACGSDLRGDGAALAQI